LTGALGDAEQAWSYADRSGDEFARLVFRATHADALHQTGRQIEADARFLEASGCRPKHQARLPAAVIRNRASSTATCSWRRPSVAAWQVWLKTSLQAVPDGPTFESQRDACRAVSERATQTLKWATDDELNLLSLAIDHLTLGRAALYAAELSCDPSSFLKIATSRVESALSGLRRSGQQYYLPAASSPAHGCAVSRRRTGPESAQTDLDEAWEIAERVPCPCSGGHPPPPRAALLPRNELPLAITSARPRGSTAPDRETRLWRRKEELEDAERAINK